MPDLAIESSDITANQAAKKPNSAWQKILIALVLGASTGLLFGQHSPLVSAETNIHFLHHISNGIIYLVDPIGTVFINAIKMMVIPVVFVSIVCGVISFSDPKLMGNISLKTISVYLITMIIALCIGLFVGKIFQPGHHLNLPDLTLASTVYKTDMQNHFSFRELFTSIVPDNPVNAFAKANVVQTVVFAIVFGLAIVCSGEHGAQIGDFFKKLVTVIEQIPILIMKFAPIGVFALITSVTAKFGLDVLTDLFTTVFVIYLGCAIQFLVVYTTILAFFLRLSPYIFFKKMLTPITYAFSTTSSAATLPYTRATVIQLGVSQKMADFIVPLGTTMNMNGLCIYLGVATIFAANLMQVDLSTVQLLIVIVSGIFAAVGAAGIPGSALIVMSLVLGSVGFNAQAIALVIGLLAGVDRITDMASTATNITGDAIAAIIVANHENQLDRKQYAKMNND